MADLAYREVNAMTRDQARLRMVMTFAETRTTLCLGARQPEATLARSPPGQ